MNQQTKRCAYLQEPHQNGPKERKSKEYREVCTVNTQKVGIFPPLQITHTWLTHNIWRCKQGRHKVLYVPSKTTFEHPRTPPKSTNTMLFSPKTSQYWDFNPRYHHFWLVTWIFHHEGVNRLSSKVARKTAIHPTLWTNHSTPPYRFYQYFYPEPMCVRVCVCVCSVVVFCRAGWTQFVPFANDTMNCLLRARWHVRVFEHTFSPPWWDFCKSVCA